LLSEANRHDGGAVHDYCLLPNYFQRLVEVVEEPLASWMKSVEGQSAHYFNQRDRKVGRECRSPTHSQFAAQSSSPALKDSIF
jgi:hypothetical protein